LGEHKISTENDCDADGHCSDPVQDITVARIIKHEKHSANLKINDIALVKLSRPADLSKRNARTICLPTEPNQQLDRITREARLKMTIAGEL